MPLHSDLRFEVSPPPARLLEQPLFKRAGTVGATQAGAALRAYTEISGHGIPEIPGLAMGRIHVPQLSLHDWNNLPLDNPLPVLVIAAEDMDGSEYRCQLFTDRSALFMAAEADDTGTPEIPLFRVLPVVFRLSGKISIKGLETPWKLSLRGPREAVQLRADPGTGPCDLLKFWSYEAPRVQRAQQALVQALDSEVCAWAREIKNLPWIIQEAGAVISGRFGSELPASGPDLEGYPFARNMALPYANFSSQQFKDCRRFLALAWAYLLDTEAKGIAAGEFAALTAQPSQNRNSGRIQTKAQFLPHSGETQEVATQRIKSAMERLMQHPKAPEGLWTLTAAGLLDCNRGGQQSDRLETVIIFHGRIGHNPPSAHDRMAALELFRDWVPAE